MIARSTIGGNDTMQIRRSTCMLSLAAAVTLSIAAAGGVDAMPLAGSLPTATSASDVGTPKVENAYWCNRWGCHPGWGYHRWGWHRWGWGYHRWGWRRGWHKHQRWPG